MTVWRGERARVMRLPSAHVLQHAPELSKPSEIDLVQAANETG